jgi:ABC-type multidrug transport system ATPase subunit
MEAVGGGWHPPRHTHTTRESLSITPGHRLTVEEHVWFYGRLKGVSAAAMGPERERLIRDVGLTLKRDTQTRHLSGELAYRGSLHGGEGIRD